MKVTTPDTFRSDLAMLLRDVPRSMAARLTGYVVPWWDGAQVVFTCLLENDLQLLEEEFELGDLLSED